MVYFVALKINFKSLIIYLCFIRHVGVHQISNFVCLCLYNSHASSRDNYDMINLKDQMRCKQACHRKNHEILQEEAPVFSHLFCYQMPAQQEHRGMYLIRSLLLQCMDCNQLNQFLSSNYRMLKRWLLRILC